jgi:hypothetical protein
MQTSPFAVHSPSRTQTMAPDPWVNHASKAKLRAIAGGIGLAVFGSAMLVDKLAQQHERWPRLLMAWNAAAGFAAGWVAMKTIDRERERRKSMTARLKMIGDLNHHVRNALQSIQLSAYSSQDQEMIASVGDSVQRIEWALREIVPQH